MSRKLVYTSLPSPPNQNRRPRDSLELASLASSSPTSSHASRSSSPSGISSSRKISLSAEDPLSASNPASANPLRPQAHNRSFSVSSAFDFASNLFPLSTTAAGYTSLGSAREVPLDLADGGNLEKHKSITYLNGLSLIVGLIIGSGIFSSPAQITTNAGSPGASLIIWLVAGILAWTGAASYAELGGAIPLNGGAQVYLSKIFGDLFGFLFTWCSVFVLKPGSAAIIAIIFGEYIVRAFAPTSTSADPLPNTSTSTIWIMKGISLLGLTAVTALNCISTELATRTGDIFMFFKFLALLAIAITGLVVALTNHTLTSYPPSDEWKTESWLAGTSTNPSSWAVALYAGLWAFDGWDNTNFVLGEFRNPARDLPRVIHTAMPLVIISYLLATLSYTLVLPAKTIASSNTIAVTFGARVFGPTGALILALIVSASCFGALNATSFTSGRLVYAAAKEGYFPAIFGTVGMPGSEPKRLHSSSSSSPSSTSKISSFLSRTLSKCMGESIGFTPIPALVFNALLTAAYVLVGEFGTLVTFYGVAGYSFYFLTVLGLIVLRVREPHLERPYRTWLSTPIIFCCVSLFLLSRAVFARPLQTLVVLGWVAAGVPVYWWRVGRGRESVGEGRFWRRWGRGGG
ncbi:MAG: hypothetical protein LQ350_004320 [Teloschistes chrysophthalmus]|nr:MAG: hypothetical protein LQ350_004320 [Niorma chrysophthalma]